MSIEVCRFCGFEYSKKEKECPACKEIKLTDSEVDD